MIFVLSGDMGDTLTMLPSVRAVRESAYVLGAQTYIVCDSRVRALIPPYPWLNDMRTLPVQSEQYVVSLNVWSAVEKFGKTMHPTQMFFRYLGMEAPEEILRPEILIDENAPICDYVVAPIANDPVRSMLHGMMFALIERLSLGANVIVVGTHGGRDAAGVHAAFLPNYPLPYVAGLMRNARRGVVTIDSMPSRLAHAAGVERHVLLCADVVPRIWAEHPGVRMLYGPQASWRVDDVIEMLAA
jgi:hypothetical protein